MQTVDVTLGHGTSAADLKPDGTVVHSLVKLVDALDTNLLQGVLDTSNEVGDELGDGATVENRTSDALRDEDTGLLGEVPSSSSVAGFGVRLGTSGLLVLHGGNTAHATVSLDKLTLVADEIFTGRLGGTSEETTHHDGRGAHGETLDDVADVLDTTVGDTGNTEAGGKVGDAADSEGLGTTDGHNLLCDTSTAAAHANSQAIDTSSDQSGGLVPSHDVSADDIDFRVGLLDELDHLNLELAVTLTAVKDNNVKASFDKELQSVLILLACSDRGGADQLLGGRQLRSIGVVKVLHQIAAGEERDEVAIVINNWQLSLLRATEDIVGLSQGSTSRGCDKIGGHDGSDGVIEVGVELNVASSDDAHELRAESPVFCEQQLVSILYCLMRCKLECDQV